MFEAPEKPSERAAARRELPAAGQMGAGEKSTRHALSTNRTAPQIDPTDLSPSQALELLYEGNRRFVAGETIEPNRNLSRLREIADRQAPFAAFLGCADSRVPIEIIFDQGFGDLFVTRIAGNVATSENIGSLEFGTQVLGAKVLYVLGHTNCGAVAATMKREPVPGQISSLFQFIRPAVRTAGPDLQAAVAANVRLQAQTLAEASPVLADRIRTGKLIVAGGVYDLATGRVTPVSLEDV
ncbi:MAG: carbonic anhydrase [Planctomycetales bacterium]|nr:carbonic anhydrase [Planctomycetales bacterium]